MRQEARKLQAERSYVIMLLFLTCSFSVFSLAAVVFIFLSVQYALSENYTHEQSTFFHVLTSNSMILNNSLNFFFYYMSGQMFRTAFKIAWNNIRGGKDNNSIR